MDSKTQIRLLENTLKQQDEEIKSLKEQLEKRSTNDEFTELIKDFRLLKKQYSEKIAELEELKIKYKKQMDSIISEIKELQTR